MITMRTFALGRDGQRQPIVTHEFVETNPIRLL